MTDVPPPAPRRSRRNLVVAIAVGVVVVLAACLVGGEFYVRDKVKSCMSNQFQQQLGTQVSIGLGAKPVLLDWLDKTVPSLTLDSQGNQFGPAVGMKVHAVVHDIKMGDNAGRAGTVGSSQADVNWSSDGIAETLKQQFGGVVTGAKTDPSTGTLEVDGLLAAKLTLKPVVTDGKIDVQTQNAEVLGFGLPTDLVDSIIKSLTASLQQSYPVGMTAQAVHVTDSGVNLSLAGGQYALPKPPPGQNNSCAA